MRRSDMRAEGVECGELLFQDAKNIHNARGAGRSSRKVVHGPDPMCLRLLPTEATRSGKQKQRPYRVNAIRKSTPENYV